MYEYRVSSIMYPSFNSSLDGLSVDIFFKGCTHNCGGCHNNELQTFDRFNIDYDRIMRTLENTQKASIVTLMGGEPLQQDLESIIHLMVGIKRKGYKVAVYTGYEWDEVPEPVKYFADYLKTGKYEGNNLTPHGFFLASKNQVMWKKSGVNWYKQWHFYSSRKSKF